MSSRDRGRDRDDRRKDKRPAPGHHSKDKGRETAKAVASTSKGKGPATSDTSSNDEQTFLRDSGDSSLSSNSQNPELVGTSARKKIREYRHNFQDDLRATKSSNERLRVERFNDALKDMDAEITRMSQQRFVSSSPQGLQYEIDEFVKAIPNRASLMTHVSNRREIMENQATHKQYGAKPNIFNFHWIEGPIPVTPISLHEFYLLGDNSSIVWMRSPLRPKAKKPADLLDEYSRWWGENLFEILVPNMELLEYECFVYGFKLISDHAAVKESEWICDKKFLSNKSKFDYMGWLPHQDSKVAGRTEFRSVFIPLTTDPDYDPKLVRPITLLDFATGHR